MGMTLRQLYVRTDADRRRRAKYCRVLQMKTGFLPNGLGYVVGRSYSTRVQDANGRFVPNPNPNHYVTMFTFINKRLQVHVSCSCADTTFRFEVANTDRGAATIEYSNGEDPDITNPGKLPSMCKHMIAMYEKIKTKLPAAHQPPPG